MRITVFALALSVTSAVVAGCAQVRPEHIEANCRGRTTGFADYYNCIDYGVRYTQRLTESRWPALAAAYGAYLDALDEQVRARTISDTSARAAALLKRVELQAIADAQDATETARLNALIQQDQMEQQLQLMRQPKSKEIWIRPSR
jgi:hypothetical protein